MYVSSNQYNLARVDCMLKCYITGLKMSGALPGMNSGNVSWRLDAEVDGPGGLASDFDGSFSGLGADLNTSTYNMRFV